MSARAKRRRSYAEIPDLDPNDAGFLRDWAPVGATRFQHHSGAHSSATLPPPGTAAPVAQPPPAKPVELSDEEGDDDAPDDVMAALALLRAQFPAAGRAAGMGPLMLKSQLYALVPDRTLVDRRIDELRCVRMRQSLWPALRHHSGCCNPLVAKTGITFTHGMEAFYQVRKVVPQAIHLPIAQLCGSSSAHCRFVTCCRESGLVRVFKLASAAADDYAYMLPADYSKLVRTMPIASRTVHGVLRCPCKPSISQSCTPALRYSAVHSRSSLEASAQQRHRPAWMLCALSFQLLHCRC